MPALIILFLLVGLASPPPASAAAVTVTAFIAQKHELTSIGTKPTPWVTVAVSRDLKKRYFGRKVQIKWGKRILIGRVESVTHKRLKRTVDVLVVTEGQARAIYSKRGEIKRI